VIIKTILRRKKKRINNNKNNNSNPQQKLKHRLQQVAHYQLQHRLKEGTQIFNLLSAKQKV